MTVQRFRRMPKEEVRLAQELCVQMGECAATYHIVMLLEEVDGLSRAESDLLRALETMVQIAESDGWDSALTGRQLAIADARRAIAAQEGEESHEAK